MAHHETYQLTDADRAALGEKAWPVWSKLLLGGLVAITLALIYCLIWGGSARFGFAYLVGFAFALAITLGCLFFVIITTLFRAGWCTSIQRVPETFAANMPTLVMLFIPIFVFMLVGGEPGLYPWANPRVQALAEGGHASADLSNPFIRVAVNPDDVPLPEDQGHPSSAFGAEEAPPAGRVQDHFTHTGDTWPAHDHAVPYFVGKKAPWLTQWSFTLRWVIYFGLWSLIGIFYWRTSLKQDATADAGLTNLREKWAPLSVIVFAVTITLASLDLIMTLDPVWYSTMFGVYFYAGAVTAGVCTIILTLMAGQRAGLFGWVTTDHYHDLGKLLFTFIFFWGYVGFSQYMLIWYASLPETTYWFEIRGMTTVQGAPTYGGPWAMVALILLFGHLLLPFGILLSRHVKRNRKALMVMAVWMLVLCFIDIWWMTMPVLTSPEMWLPIPELLCAAGCVAIMVAGALRMAARHPLIPYNDPRLHESLALDASAWAPVHAGDAQSPGKH